MRLTSKLTKVSVYSPIGNRDGNLEGTPAYLPGSPHHPGGVLKGGKAAGGYYRIGTVAPPIQMCGSEP